jgi:hypothetical protein
VQKLLAPVNLTHPITCYNNKDGKVTLELSGGEPPYYVTITPTPTVYNPSVYNTSGSYELAGLTDATYSILVRDARASTIPYRDITLSQPGFLTIIKPVYKDQYYMYRPYEILYTYQGGARDQLVDIDLYGPRGLVYNLATAQSAGGHNNTAQIHIPHHIIPGRYHIRVGNTLCINQVSGDFVIHASHEAQQATNFP